jgi:hypothetical protein
MWQPTRLSRFASKYGRVSCRRLLATPLGSILSIAEFLVSEMHNHKTSRFQRDSTNDRSSNSLKSRNCIASKSLLKSIHQMVHGIQQNCGSELLERSNCFGKHGPSHRIQMCELHCFLEGGRRFGRKPKLQKHQPSSMALRDKHLKEVGGRLSSACTFPLPDHSKPGISFQATFSRLCISLSSLDSYLIRAFASTSATTQIAMGAHVTSQDSESDSLGRHHRTWTSVH